MRADTKRKSEAENNEAGGPTPRVCVGFFIESFLATPHHVPARPGFDRYDPGRGARLTSDPPLKFSICNTIDRSFDLILCVRFYFGGQL